MITLIAIQIAVVFLFLTVRALMPELFVVGQRASQNTPTFSYTHNQRRRRVRTTRPVLAHCLSGHDATHSAGLGMMIH